MGLGPLEGEVTRPQSFDPKKDYAIVIARGGNDEHSPWLGDYDVIDAQSILRQDLAVLSKALFVEGALIFEAGGTIGATIPGVNIGVDQLGSAGSYIGIESQLYTVKLLEGGPAGTATYTWRSTGADGPNYAGQSFIVTAIAPDLTTALDDLGLYGHPVGALGLLVVFVNSNATLTGGNSWAIDVTYGAKAPTVDVDDSQITVSDVLIPVQGRVHRVAGTTLTYPPAVSGASVVYAEWIREIITEVDDPSLRDPSSQTPQAWRERWRVTLQTQDTSSLPLGSAQLERRVFAVYNWDRATNIVTKIVPRSYAIDIDKTQGAIESSRLLGLPQNEILLGLLAKRDYHPHGSYVSFPLYPVARAVLSTNPPSAGKIRIRLHPYEASIVGVEVSRTEPEDIEVDQATDVATVVGEGHVYTAVANPFALNKTLGLQTFPIKQVDRLIAQVQVGNPGVGGYEAVTRGAGTDDLLSKTPVESILRISNTQGGAADYIQGTDYSLAGNSIHWIAGHSAPGTGIAYYVAYTYNKQMVGGTDYLLTGDGEIDFSPGGDDPIEGTTFLVDYDYYLARYDAIILRPNNEFAVVRGLPAENPVLPSVPALTLGYVQVQVPPNSVAASIRRYSNDAIGMEMLNRVVDFLSQVDRDFALQDLLNQARNRTTASFYDVLAEDFSTLEIADFLYNVGGVEFAATVDVVAGELTLPFDSASTTLTRIAPPAGQTEVRIGAEWYTLPYTHELAISEPYWSRCYPANSGGGGGGGPTDPPGGPLEPATAIITQSVDFTYFINPAAKPKSSITRLNYALYAAIYTRLPPNTKTRLPLPQPPPPVQAQAPAYIRELLLHVKGEHWLPGEKIRVKFDGKDLEFTHVSPSVQGADAFTIIADATGKMAGTFLVPHEAVPVGAPSSQFFGNKALVGSVWPGDYTVRATGKFSTNPNSPDIIPGSAAAVAAGAGLAIAHTTQDRPVQNHPIAQSILFDDPRMLSKVDVPLCSAPDTSAAPLIIEIRNTDRSGDASTPISEVVEARSLELTDVNVGPTSSNPVVFDDPIMMNPGEFRDLVVRSSSLGYEVYVAELGAQNQANGGFITSLAFPNSSFLDSTNNRDWRLHQGWELRSQIYVAHMSSTLAYLYLDRVTPTAPGLTSFFLPVQQIVPDNTSIKWQYSIDGLAIDNVAKAWITFQPFVRVELAAVAAQIDLRAVLATADPYVTPAVTRDALVLVTECNATASKYISREKPLTAAATIVKGAVDLRTPAGGSQTVYVSVNDGANFYSITLPPGVTGLDGFTHYEFEGPYNPGALASLPPGAKLRGRIDQSTPDRAQRPRARNFYLFAQPV